MARWFRQSYAGACSRRVDGDLAQATLLTLGVWSVLPAASLLAGYGVRSPVALFAMFLVVTGVTAFAAPRRLRRRGDSCLLLGLGLVAGAASYPAWVIAIAGSGLLLGLDPRTPVPAGGGTPVLWVATLGLAPVLEELVYRERLLPALERQLSATAAVVLSSAAFAIPHLEPWTLLASFLVGLFLGCVMRLGSAVELCIGLHTGLNAAALARGVPPAESPLSTGLSALVAAASLLLGVGLAREARAPEVP